jgi:hypothetical protein
MCRLGRKTASSRAQRYVPMICHKRTKSKHQRHRGNRSRHSEEGSHSESDRTAVEPFALFELVEIATASGLVFVCVSQTESPKKWQTSTREVQKNVDGSNILLLNTTAEPGVQRQTSTREVQKNVDGSNILLLNTMAEPGVQRLSSVASVSAASLRYYSCLFRLILL